MPTQLITGLSDLGRQATNPQWQYPTVYNPKVNYTRIVDRHSIKSGYEFQHIQTEVQDVNPLYGRDQYAGQFTRPTGAANSNLYNLADFMFGLRSTYALSNILVANLRQNMHFLYLQDDLRVNDRLTLNLGVRYEYATPWVEKDNILSNFDPATRQMVLARDGSLEDRATVTPDRNNIGPRLGMAYTLTARTVLRGGYGVSYVHFHRAGGANVLPINGPQVINAVVVQGNALDPAFRRTEQGYDAGLTDPSRFNPLAANITYMPRDYHSSQVQSWFASVQREFGPRMIVDVAYVGNRADDLLLFANLNQAAPNNAAGTIPLQATASDSGVCGYHLLVQRWQVALSRAAGQAGLARAQRVLDPQLADAVADEGQRRRLAGESQRQLPGAAGHQQPRGRLRIVRLSSALQQHDEPRLDDAVPEPSGCAIGRSPRSTPSTRASRSPSSTRRSRRSRCPVFSRTSAARTTIGRTWLATPTLPSPSARSRTGSTATMS